METKRNVELPSLIQQILSLTEENDFDRNGPSEVESVGEGEEVLFEMTPWEKACFVYRRIMLSQARQKAQGGLVKGKEMYNLRMQYELCSKLFQDSIRERLPEDGPSIIGVRAGWKVVGIKEGCSCPVCQAKRAGVMSGVQVIEIDLLAPRPKGFMARIFGGQ